MGRAGAPLATAGALGADWKPGPADPVTGAELAGAGAAADAAAGATLLGGATGVCAGRLGAGAGAAAAGSAGAVAGRATGAGAAGRATGVPGRPGPPAGAGEVLGAAAPLVVRSAFADAGLVAGKASRSLRTTGASMVEDGDLTNSPRSVSFAMISLLVLPSSFASSWTRALPATALLRVRAAAGSERPLALSCAGRCSLLLHGVLTFGSTCFLPSGGSVIGVPMAARSVDPLSPD